LARQVAARREEIVRRAARGDRNVNVGKSVGSFVPRLAQKAFEKFGFSTVALLTDWPAIVGQELAGYTLPERLKWPRKANPRGEAQGDAEAGCEGRPGATLVIRVEPSRALDVQYGAAQIIERINSYFGYRAVSELRLQQLSIDAGGNRQKAPQPEETKAQDASRGPSFGDELLAGIVDERLRDSLQRLQTGILSQQH
jgi:hypothetical protein